jgi:hypothetical protein
MRGLSKTDSFLSTQQQQTAATRRLRLQNEGKIMNTGPEHQNEKLVASTTVRRRSADHVQSLITGFSVVRPILAALAAIPFIPDSWRAVLSALVITLDQVTLASRRGRPPFSLAGGD